MAHDAKSGSLFWAPLMNCPRPQVHHIKEILRITNHFSGIIDSASLFNTLRMSMDTSVIIHYSFTIKPIVDHDRRSTKPGLASCLGLPLRGAGYISAAVP